ncbi:MAG TPA: hypothetical protein PK156_28960 [Polyangium sp.]|nr:hypothetical protein [Polyangium sp.]
MMTILELIERIGELDDEDVIFAKPEWNEHSEARIFRLTSDYRVPPEAIAFGFKYFLEVAVVKQVLDEFQNRPNVSMLAKCRRVIYYATFDA